MLRIVPCYAAALALLYVYLSFRVIQVRRSAKQAIGNGGVADLERRARVHANFAEYVPFALVLLAMAELRGAWAPLLYGLCLLLVAGRCTHAWGVGRVALAGGLPVPHPRHDGDVCRPDLRGGPHPGNLTASGGRRTRDPRPPDGPDQGFSTTLMQPSFLSRKVLYSSGPSSSFARWVMTKDGSILPSSIHLRSLGR